MHPESSAASMASHVEDSPHRPPPFAWSQLWKPAIVNPVNLKSYTIPFFNLADPYAQNFHLSWLGFFVAFLSWFAFPPLMTEAIKGDLKLTDAEISNSGTIALTSTFLVRIVVGPLVDRYGPRRVMAAILIFGAIPSGLAGLAHNAVTLNILRFFIGVLGATFVPCQAWTSAFFDKSCVGFANALVGGWGDMGGGATFIIMASLYEGLHRGGLSPHVAWRASFAIVPVPVLILVAVLTLVFGKDHPSDLWPEHKLPPTELATKQGHQYDYDGDEKQDRVGMPRTMTMTTQINQIDYDGYEKQARVGMPRSTTMTTMVDVAVNQSLTLKSAFKILISPLTWLPALGYFTTFGLELLVNSKLADVLFALFKDELDGFDQKTAGYYTAILGMLNLVTRPFGGYVADVVYRRWGTTGKKYWMLLCGIIMGGTAIAGGFYLAKDRHPHVADLPTLMGIFSVALIFSEMGNGANYALVPHCNPNNNGVMSGLVGAFGTLGGMVFTIIFRFETGQGKAFWITGLICLVSNVLMLPISMPKSR